LITLIVKFIDIKFEAKNIVLAPLLEKRGWERFGFLNPPNPLFSKGK